MPSKAIIKWLTSAFLFLLASSGVVDPKHMESLRGIIELAITGIVFIGASFVYGYEIIHKIKHPHDTKENALVALFKRALSKVWIVEQKPVVVESPNP